MAVAKPNLLVITSPTSPELSVLNELKGRVNVVGIGKTSQELDHLSQHDWASVDCLLNCGVSFAGG
jgi:hypothetical protein